MKPDKRSDLAALVPSGGTIIELGVAAGEFAEQLLTSNRDAIYYGIDRWSDHHDLAEMDAANKRLDAIDATAILIRSTFRAYLPSVVDGSADLIYVDGYAHTGQEGGETLRDWWPKVKPGGIFAGHDYDNHYPQTVQAVDAFVAGLRSSGVDVELNVIQETPNSSWWIQKP